MKLRQSDTLNKNLESFGIRVRVLGSKYNFKGIVYEFYGGDHAVPVLKVGKKKQK